MSVKQRLRILMYSALVGAALLPAYSAAAADDAQQADRLQRQIDAMQQQVQALQRQVAETKRAAQTAQQSVGFAGAGGPPPAGYGKVPVKAPWPAGVTIKVGGFIEAATAWRQRNELSDGASDPGFASLPFQNSPLYHENEFRGSARQSRISLQALGDIDPAQHLMAYFETDFLGAGVTANSRESNSYNLRIRHAFMTYDNDDWHFHFLAGQSWSLLTQDRVGIVPLKENIPLVIDAQYVVGFNWARQEQLRFVGDWNKIAWFAVSVEAPQVNFVSNTVPAAGAGPSPLPPGLNINALNTCNASGLLDSTTACSNDTVPDIVEKFALDPGWGHYEAFGLQRWFTDRVFTTVDPGSGRNKTTFGWGVGGSVLLPIWAKYVDFQGSVMTGQGIGRYGSSQLPDVTVGPDGSLAALQTTQVLLGLIVHPTPSLDVYAYAGEEQVNANAWTIGATQGGFGNPNFGNGGCQVEIQTGGGVGFNTPAAGLCTANVRRTEEITVGFWQNVYKGDMGRVAFGAQYEFVKLDAFPGLATPSGPAGPTPNASLSPNNQIIMTSVRYYPFQ